MLRPAAMLRPIVVTTLIAAGLCSVAHADVYRWVDDKGEPHYSDRWVPGSELIKTSRPHPLVTEGASSTGAQDQNKAVNNAAQSATDKLAKKANSDAVKQDVAKTRAAQCKAAKQRYQEAIDARRLYKPPKPGDTDRVYMSDAETDAYRAQVRSEVTDACGAPPPPAQPQSETPSEQPEK
jgi:Domain of unknown function (DUF4124)